MSDEFPIDQVTPESQEFPFAGLLEPEELAIISRHVYWHRVEKGGFLWTQGDMDGRVALVVHGRVKLAKEMTIPGRPLVLGLFGPGDIVGDLSFATGSPSATSAQALEPLTVVLMERESYDLIARENPALANRILDDLLRNMANQLQHAYERLTAVF